MLTRKEILDRLNKAREPKAKKIPKPINKQSSKKVAQVAAEKAAYLETKNVNRETLPQDQKDQWFAAQRIKMTGKCLFCGGKTEKYNDATFKRSAAHLFAKRKAMFPSIKLHPENDIELCHYDNSCHTNFDQSMITF